MKQFQLTIKTFAVLIVAFGLQMPVLAQNADETLISVDFNKEDGTISKSIGSIMCDPLGHGYEFIVPDNVLGAKCVRVGWGGDLGFYLNPWPAEGVYDWENLDRYLDKFQEQGYKILFPICFTPKWLWPDHPDVNTYHGPKRFFKYYKKGYAFPPNSYKKYEEMIYQTVKHLVVDKKYNIEFEALNEPENDMFWAGGLDEFLKIYTLIARTVKRVSQDIVIGGPAISTLSQKHRYFMKGFIEHCSNNDVPVDFISWHYYGARNTIGDEVNYVKELIRNNPIKVSPKMYITEASLDWRPDSRMVQTPFHGAFIAQTYKDMLDAGIEKFYYCGEMGTLEELNPASQATAMFNLLDETKLEVELTGEKTGVGVIASKNEEGITLLIWNLPALKPDLPVEKQKITINVENLPDATYHYRRYLTDSKHMPGPMQKVFRKSLLMNVPDNMVFNKDQVTRLPLEFELETYGITLIQLEMDIKHSSDLDMDFRKHEMK